MKLVKDGKTLNILVQPELYDAVKKEAESKYMSVSAFVRTILAERYFDVKEKR